jgi:hypothetical protein
LALPWQIVVADGVGVEGVPTVGVTVTVVEAAADGPLHPFAVTLTVAVPEKPGAQVTVPLVPVPEIVFPVPETVQL